MLFACFNGFFPAELMESDRSRSHLAPPGVAALLRSGSQSLTWRHTGTVIGTLAAPPSIHGMNKDDSEAEFPEAT